MLTTNVTLCEEPPGPQLHGAGRARCSMTSACAARQTLFEQFEGWPHGTSPATGRAAFQTCAPVRVFEAGGCMPQGSQLHLGAAKEGRGILALWAGAVSGPSLSRSLWLTSGQRDGAILTNTSCDSSSQSQDGEPSFISSGTQRPQTRVEALNTSQHPRGPRPHIARVPFLRLPPRS